ncbi:MAG: hypothetical protein KGZ52_05730 [Xanthomonadaceae bacterium]|jgi:ribosome-associated translation inhibitor RaiA|nr:hypothetical protein [Xanthomonadaceae bacterium]
MRIELLHRHHPRHADLHEAVFRRATRLLGRMSHRVDGLTVSVADLNGPKGGVDRQCQVEARLHDGRFLHARARSAEVGKAVDAALHKILKRIVRGRERHVDARRHAPPPARGISAAG